MKLVVLILIVTSTHASKCPSSWAVYKNVEEGSYVYMTQNSDQFSLFRKTFYRCSVDNNIEFHTNWSVVTNGILIPEKDAAFLVNDTSSSCIEDECNNITLIISVSYRSRFECFFIWHWSSWTNGHYSYIKKNNKL